MDTVGVQYPDSGTGTAFAGKHGKPCARPTQHRPPLRRVGELNRHRPNGGSVRADVVRVCGIQPTPPPPGNCFPTATPPQRGGVWRGRSLCSGGGSRQPPPLPAGEGSRGRSAAPPAGVSTMVSKAKAPGTQRKRPKRTESRVRRLAVRRELTTATTTPTPVGQMTTSPSIAGVNPAMRR